LISGILIVSESGDQAGGIMKMRISSKKKTKNKTTKKQQTNNGIKKQYLKSRPMCKVTFRLPKEAAPEAATVAIAGDFNNWNAELTKMKKLKNGDFTRTVELPCEGEFKFRYLIDSSRWENDWCADKYVPNGLGEDDSVVIV
jgi:1,4-alpha-glucan branching enzyme